MSDLFIGADVATEAERAAVDEVVGGSLGPAVIVESERLVRSGAARRNERRHLLLPVLHALQNRVGWISPGGLNHACEQLQVPPAEAYGVATFYELFRVDDPGHDDDVVHVCVDAACQIAGSAEADRRAPGRAVRMVHASPCLGQCERPVARFIQGRAKPDRVEADTEPYRIPQAGQPGLRLLRRIGGGAGRHRGGPDEPRELCRRPAGTRRWPGPSRWAPQAVVDEVVTSGLLGRGGAAFPTGVKWRAVARRGRRQKHVVVNADESEPGTFKDRVRDGERSVRPGRSADHRRLRHRCHQGLDLHQG